MIPASKAIQSKLEISIPTHTYTDPELATKNISISEEAYSRLAAQKKANESFTDVINRLTGRRSAIELAGILNKAEAQEVRSEIRKLRKRSSKRILQTIRRLN